MCEIEPELCNANKRILQDAADLYNGLKNVDGELLQDLVDGVNLHHSRISACAANLAIGESKIVIVACQEQGAPLTETPVSINA